MRIIAQRVKEASVSVDGRLVAAIDAGIMALVGFGQEDGPDYRSSPSYTAMARKLVGLRIFPGTGENAHKFPIGFHAIQRLFHHFRIIIGNGLFSFL